MNENNLLSFDGNSIGQSLYERPNQLTFKSEQFAVDYITLNVSNSNLVNLNSLAVYLSKFGFNSICKANEKDTGKVIVNQKKNPYKVIFVESSYNPRDKKYWDGVYIRFSGSNARHFYSMLKEQTMKIQLFPLVQKNIELGRFDIHYNLFELSIYQTTLIKEFLENCKKKYLQKYPLEEVEIKRTKKGWLLKAKSRKKRQQHFRIYEKANSLRFELEMRKLFIESYQNSLFSGEFEALEHALSQVFYREFNALCILDSAYSNWLADGLRRIISIQKLANLELGTSKNIISPYNLRFTGNKELSFQCLQLLSFLQTSKVRKDFRFAEELDLGILKFYLADFVEFVGKDKKSSYHRKEIYDFLDDLLKLDPLRVKVNDFKFQKYYFCSRIDIEKCNNRWMIELRVAVSCLNVIYPYAFPAILLSYSKKSDVLIQSQFIETFNSKNIVKEFRVENIYEKCSLSSKEKKRRRSLVICILKELENEKCIDSRIKVTYKTVSKQSEWVELKSLTDNILGKISKLYFTENFSQGSVFSWK